jgi:tetratricopeptide (TPR) repeat protein
MAQKNLNFSTMSSKKASVVSKLGTPKSSLKPTHIQTQPVLGTSENFIIFWLDSKVTNSTEETISKLRTIVKTVKIFTDIDQCIKSLIDIKNEKVFLVISNSIGQEIVPIVQQFTQLDSIYVLCNRKLIDDRWAKSYIKIKGIFTDIETLFNVLKATVHRSNNDVIPISIIPMSSVTNLNELEPSFMYFQLLKENLLAIKYDENAKKEFVDSCCSRYRDKYGPLIDEFEQEYKSDLSIAWYTKESFLYIMLNESLRELIIETIIKMGFYIQNLHEQIKQRHSRPYEQSLSVVYRGQTLSNVDFEKTKKAQGGLLFFNSFVSTSTIRSVALTFARKRQDDPIMTGILFEMKIDPSITSVPFASIRNESRYPDEDEILFSMSTVFRIDRIEMIEDRIWQINLTMTDDNDQQLKRLTDHIRKGLGSDNGWRSLGQLMIKMGELKRAEEIYNKLLKISSNDIRECAFLHNQLGYIWKQKGDLPVAYSHYVKSLNISLDYLSSDDLQLSSRYSNIGGILKMQGNLDGALKNYERALICDRQVAEPNLVEIAIDYNNIGSVLDDQGKYSDALKSYKEALEIKLDYLPPHHPSLANTYSNIALVYRKMGDSSMALLYYKQALEIKTKSLQAKHPSFIVTHGNMAEVLKSLDRYNEAIEHADQAATIAKHVFGSDHVEYKKRQTYLKELQEKL